MITTFLPGHTAGTQCAAACAGCEYGSGGNKNIPGNDMKLPTKRSYYNPLKSKQVTETRLRA
jgi:hypothetical protein